MDWTAWSSDPILGSWVPLLGVMVGATLFVGWQRRHGGPRVVPVDFASLPSYRRAQVHMGTELARMRRYERSLSVMVVRLEANPMEDLARAEANGSRSNAKAPHLAFWEIGAVLRDLLRESDVASTDMSKAQYIVLLPETNREQALQTAHRVRKLVFATTELELEIGIAEFPAQGLILEELVKSAVEDCERSRNVGVAV